MTMKDALKAGDLYDSDVPPSVGQSYPKRKKEILYCKDTSLYNKYSLNEKTFNLQHKFQSIILPQMRLLHAIQTLNSVIKYMFRQKRMSTKSDV